MAAPKGPAPALLTPCPACGAPVLVARHTGTGATMALDVRSGPHTYSLVIHDGQATVQLAGAYVSHVLTCPAAEPPAAAPGLPRGVPAWQGKERL